MKYTLELLLHKSRAEVWRVFDDPNSMDKWQTTLIKFERISGIAGQPGAVARLTFKNGDQEFILIEKVTYRAKPERLDGLYENEFADNIVKNTFIEQGRDETLWKVEVEFKFKTLIMRITGPLMKKRFAANTQKDMESFKKLVESP